MDYTSTLDYLFNKLPIYQRKGTIAYKADIGNIVEATKQLNNPHNKFKSIHIAGTNGKGSVAHMLASVLQEAGYKTGLYTSPHLKDFRERIKINGKMIAEQEVIDFVWANKKLFNDLEMSFFEMTVAMAFDYFAKNQVDIAIIECGLGGRLDSTNIIDPELAIITNIGIDHTDLLGETLEKIAAEKAGIIKTNRPIIIGKEQEETKNIFVEKAKEKHAAVYIAGKGNQIQTDLKGKWQIENSNTALKAIELLKAWGWNIDDENIRDGFKSVIKNTGLLGRWQVLNNKPLSICDTAHNEDGIRLIVQHIKQTPHEHLHFVFGTVSDKNSSRILRLLPKQATYYFCKAAIPRAVDATLLKEDASHFGLKGEVFPNVIDAFAEAKKRAKNKDLIFVGGSTFVVAEVL
jgi:dihydrofolate synthase/folylpolyglutamate synthase